MSLYLIISFVTSFIIAIVFGKLLIPYLQKIKAGQEIRPEGPSWHNVKAGTPTMGGLIFILGTIVCCLGVGFWEMRKGNFTHIFILFFALIYGAVGFLDDYKKLKKKQNLGLTAKGKLLLQIPLALIFTAIMLMTGITSYGGIKPGCVDIYVPFFNTAFALNLWIYLIFAVFVIVGTVNSVNLTDGLDGLCSGVSIPVFVFFSAYACMKAESNGGIAIFSAALTGGLFGFLYFNWNPAKIFMGDTGSLFLGGAVAACAFACDMPMILVTLGIIYILEALSDIIQVSYFKITHGKRIFKMAPLHHHLEMGGFIGKKWKEKELFCLFGGISLVFAVLSFLGVMSR